MIDATRNNEEMILRLTITAMLGITGTVELCYEDDRDPALTISKETAWSSITEQAFACYSCNLRVGSKWVFFIWGNGDDGLSCIADCTSSLNETLTPVFEEIDAFEQLGLTWRK